VGLERVPLSLVSTIEELLGRKSSDSGQEIREYGCRDPSRWPVLALTSPTSGGRSVGIVRSLTQATEFSFRTLLEMPPAVQLLKKYATFCGTKRFVTLFTRAWSLS
jgi:hypothetical protein